MIGRVIRFTCADGVNSPRTCLTVCLEECAEECSGLAEACHWLMHPCPASWHRIKKYQAGRRVNRIRLPHHGFGAELFSVQIAIVKVRHPEQSWCCGRGFCGRVYGPVKVCMHRGRSSACASTTPSRT